MGHVKFLDHSSTRRKVISFIPENILFEGSNIFKFISFSNKLIDDLDLNDFTDIISSSANAIVTLLVGLGYSSTEIKFKLNILYSSIQRDEKLLLPENFTLWIKHQINNRLNDPLATFDDLHKKINNKCSKILNFKNIHFLVLNINTGKLECLNYKNTPNLPILIAINICMSIFTAFPIVEINNNHLVKKGAYIDGGIILQHINAVIKIAVSYINSCEQFSLSNTL